MKQIQRRVEDHADATGADQPEDRRLSDIDVPAKERDRPEGGLDLRPIAESQSRQPRRARRIERFDRTAGRFLDCFAEQLADEADRAKCNSQRSRQRARPENADEKQRPDE